MGARRSATPLESGSIDIVEVSLTPTAEGDRRAADAVGDIFRPRDARGMDRPQTLG